MAGDTTFLVEDFVEAIALQLDRVQDALAIKAEVRPLTYALKDFSLQLHVFAEMDDQGQVRFRNSGPNESGASVVSMDFTTITTPMIRENTISLAQARGPTLDEAGLTSREQLQLARLGVRTLHQLQKLGSITGPRNIARLAGLPIDRLQQAILLGRPTVTGIQPHPLPAPTNGEVAQPPPAGPPVHLGPPISVGPPTAAGPPIEIGPTEPPTPVTGPPSIQPLPVASRLRIQGRNLLDNGNPDVRFNGQPLAIAEADDDGLTVHLPHGVSSGHLEIDLPGGETLAYQLNLQEGDANGHSGGSA